MKLIQCIIQPFKLEDVIDALQLVAPGMTLSEAKGHGHQRGQPLVYRGHEYEVSLLPKVMIEIVVGTTGSMMSSKWSSIKRVLDTSATGEYSSAISRKATTSGRDSWKWIKTRLS